MTSTRISAINSNVFIILCTYNPELRFFEEQIESLRAQSFSGWHCLILDDNSNSGHLEGIRRAISKDNRFTLISNLQRLGTYHNFERGLSKLPEHGDFVFYSDQDDVWRPDKMEKMLFAMESSGALLAYSDLSLIDENGRLIHNSCFSFERRIAPKHPLELLFGSPVTGCACAFRRELVAHLLPFPTFDQIPGATPCLHDGWTALMAGSLGRMIEVKEPLVAYRQHKKNQVGVEQFRTWNIRATANDLLTLCSKERVETRNTYWRNFRRLVLEYALRLRAAQPNNSLGSLATDMVRPERTNARLIRLTLTLIIRRDRSWRNAASILFSKLIGIEAIQSVGPKL